MAQALPVRPPASGSILLEIDDQLRLQIVCADGQIPSEISMPLSSTVQQLVDYIERFTTIKDQDQRLFFRGTEMTHRLSILSSLGMVHSSVVYLQTAVASVEHPIVAYGPVACASNDAEEMLRQCAEGLLNGHNPVRAPDGKSGTYFMMGPKGQKVVACLKPADEELGAPNNPHGNAEANHSALESSGITPTTQYVREIAAQLLDAEGFHGVPPTMCVEVAHHEAFNGKGGHGPKIASLQRYVDGENVEEHGPVSKFSADEVHKIGILDIRLLNCDRNGYNLLGRLDDDEKSFVLTPIDHGLSMPHRINIMDLEWVWFSGSQWKKYFSVKDFSVKTKKFIIEGIDIEADIRRLQQHFVLDERVIENLRISHMVLTEGVKAGLTLYQIASMIVRDLMTWGNPTALEVLISEVDANGIMARDYDAADDVIMAQLKKFNYTADEIVVGVKAAVNKKNITEITLLCDGRRARGLSSPPRRPPHFMRDLQQKVRSWMKDQDEEDQDEEDQDEEDQDEEKKDD